MATSTPVYDPLEHDGSHVYIRLSSFYFISVFFILGIGSFFLAQATSFYFSNFKQLPSILKPYAMNIVWYWYVVLVYIARDAYNIHVGYIIEDTLCKAQGLMNIGGILTLRISAAITAYGAYGLASGKPINDMLYVVLNILGAIIGFAFALGFTSFDAYGSYKNLYCCLKEDKYIPTFTGSCFVVTFSSIFCVVFFYFAAFQKLKGHDPNSQVSIVVRRALLHGILFYVFWSLIIAAGTATAVNVRVPVVIDLIAAWAVKLEVAFDSWFLMHTVNLMVAPAKGGKKSSKSK